MAAFPRWSVGTISRFDFLCRAGLRPCCLGGLKERKAKALPYVSSPAGSGLQTTAVQDNREGFLFKHHDRRLK